MIKASCENLIKREERFSKTAVGWVLRDISKCDSQFVISFIEKYLSHFTSESLKNALKYYEKEIRDIYLEKLKNV